MKLPVLVVGMGKSGQAALRLLALLGYPKSQIKTFDAKPGVADFAKPEDLLSFKPDLLVVSPGVDLNTSWIQSLVKSGSTLTSELDLACQNLSDEKIIGITGSMGKSTTTSLLAEGARAIDSHSFAGGNLGTPLADYIADVLENKRPRAKWIILELSSYQLENCPNLKTDVSILTALSPNHLERYASLEDYYNAKWTLKGKTKGSFFLNFDNPEVARWCAPRLNQQCLQVRTSNSELKAYNLKESKLVGSHNQQNLALAVKVAVYFKWPSQSIQAIKNYAGLTHRLEFVTEKNGAKFINDSKATTIESVIAAVNSCVDLVGPNGSLVLLAGGRDKNLPWEELRQLNAVNSIQFVFFGECGAQAQTKSGLPGKLYPNLKQALAELAKIVQPNDLILLSPGGSSLDEFKNFEERGEFFKNWVHSLK